MKYLVVLGFGFLASPALAHPGLHLHPHGVDLAWVALVAFGGLGGYGAARIAERVRKDRRK